MNLYDVKLSRGHYIPPFIAVDDNMALNALKELATTLPMVHKCYLRHIGEYDLATGRIKVLKPRIVYKENK